MPLASPPEKMTMRLPSNVAWTTWRMRSVEGLRRDLALLVDLLRLVLLDVSLRRLDLDDVRAELRGDLRGVGADVDRRLALLREAGAARVAPDDDGEALALGLER